MREDDPPVRRVIVFAERQTEVDPRVALADLGNDDATGLLIRFGQIEAGIADALCPEVDDDDPLISRLREINIQLADSTVAPGHILAELEGLDLPSRIQIRPPEGFAYYGLFPEQYAEAARQFARVNGAERIFVIGIRSIGTTLASVVTAVLRGCGRVCDSCTVRPRGHPFDRYIALGPALEKRIADSAAAHFLIVDEGPGLSGSSFLSVARRLEQLGIPRAVISLLPSWDPSPEFLHSEVAREHWNSYPKYLGTFEETVLTGLATSGGLCDLSAGNWRRYCFSSEAEYPAVEPHHERRKYLSSDGTLFKFAGLGSFGRQKLARAEVLAAEGFIPPVLGLRLGFLLSKFVKAKPLTPEDVNPELLAAIAKYLCFLKRHFRAQQPVSYISLMTMIRTNLLEPMGATYESVEDLEGPINGADAVAVDGRMLPHEWLRAPGRYLKTDALDHHDDHFFPGCQDIAWDLAGTMIEFRLSARHREHLLELYLQMDNDSTLRRRLVFYEIAYLAYRFAYTRMAEHSTGEPAEGGRFHTLHNYYAGQARALLFG